MQTIRLHFYKKKTSPIAHPDLDYELRSRLLIRSVWFNRRPASTRPSLDELSRANVRAVSG
jgi:hypothetical protein